MVKKGNLYYKTFMKSYGVMETNKSHTYRVLGIKNSPWSKSDYVLFYDTSSDRRIKSEVQYDFFIIGFVRVE